MPGNRRNWQFKTVTSSSTPISMYPNWDYTERSNKNKTFSRTQGAQLNVFRVVGGYTEYSLPVDYVSSSTAGLFNTWWEEQTHLHMFINKDVAGEELSSFVKIINKFIPFGQNVPGKFSDFKGTVLLATYDEEPSTSPFILDDLIFGVLDTNVLG